MIDSERVERIAQAMWDKGHMRSWACAGFQQQEYRVMARAALTADAQPVGDAPRYQPIDAPITGVAAPEPLVYKDADTPSCPHALLRKIGNLGTGPDKDRAYACQNCRSWFGVTLEPYRRPTMRFDADAGQGVQAMDSIDKFKVPESHSLINNEVLADLYIRLSGKTRHTSDCATSIAPAETPGPCDCDMPIDAAPLHSWEQIEKVLREVEAENEYLGVMVNAWLADIRARLTARERVTVPEAIKDLLMIPAGLDGHLDSQKFCADINANMQEAFIRGMEAAGKMFEGLYWGPYYPPQSKIAEKVLGLRQELAQQKAAKEGQ
jgi:hypothetical protein